MLEKRAQYLDGLRGISCLWIMFYHLAVLLELPGQLDLGLFYRGMVPVYLFFILSGFVIAGLLVEKQESYGEFIFRRFFRIWPVFVVLCTAAILLLPLSLATLEQLNTQNKAIQQHVAIYQASQQHWLAHWLAHSSMLHGFFDDWLAWSSKAFIPPGWTVTVEWQFYLVAPLLVASFRYGLVLLVWGGFYLLRLQYGTATEGAWLFEYADSFLLGIASYLAVKRFGDSHGWQLFAAFVLLALFFYSRNLAYAGHIAMCLWLGFMALLYCPWASLRRHSQRLFGSRILVFYGDISYPLYLLHMLVIFILLSVSLPWRNEFAPVAFFVVNALVLLLAGSIGAWCIHRWLEWPCMRWAAARARQWRSPT